QQRPCVRTVGKHQEQLGDEVLQVARTVGRPPGLHRLDDLLLEYQLSRPSHARGRLAALLAPLEDGGELLATLRVHLSGGLNRRHTAQVLHLHPNTVDYRLRRIAVLTGLDPARPAHLPRITAAIAARDAERDTGHRAVPAGPPGRCNLPSVPDPKDPKDPKDHQDPKDHSQDHQGRQAPPGLLRRSDHSGRSEPAQEPT
ncbi:PucR family transcriptional regulator, partial [Kitasatospora sp. NPDC001574]